MECIGNDGKAIRERHIQQEDQIHKQSPQVNHNQKKESTFRHARYPITTSHFISIHPGLKTVSMP